MVSGWVTSPYELSKIDSGEAKLMVTWEKSLVNFLFFLNDMIRMVYRQSSEEGLMTRSGLDKRVYSKVTSSAKPRNS